MNDERTNKMFRPADILDEYSGIDTETRRRAEAFLDEWDGWEYGHSPKVAVAMAVFYVNMSKYGWTQEEVADLFGVTKESMRSLWTKAENELSTEALCELEVGQYS